MPLVTDTRRTPGVTVQPVPIEAVRIGDGFWRGWLDRLCDVTLPTQHAQCESTGRLDNIRRVSGRVDAPFRGRYYDESDVYKWLEAASWALAGRDDRRLRALVDALVDDIAAAQQPDGYLHTYFALERADQRYTDLINKHELYCAGHLIQAGIAHHRATGAETAAGRGRAVGRSHLRRVRSRTPVRRRTGIPRSSWRWSSWRARPTGASTPSRRGSFWNSGGSNRRGWVDIAISKTTSRRPSNRRSRDTPCGRSTWRAGWPMPVWSSRTPRCGRRRSGSGAAPTRRRVYVTGGLGAHWAGESFGDAFDLPNRNSYAESCAAVAGVMWNWRLLAGTGDARYADWLETTLYNGMLAGLSLDGAHYFYPNPLSASAGNARVAWFECACCPPNLARLLASLPGYLYGVSERALWVHQFAAGRVDADVPGAGRLSLEVDTDYPWSGEIRLTVRQAPGGSGGAAAARARVVRRRERRGSPRRFGSGSLSPRGRGLG